MVELACELSIVVMSVVFRFFGEEERNEFLRSSSRFIGRGAASMKWSWYAVAFKPLCAPQNEIANLGRFLRLRSEPTAANADWFRLKNQPAFRASAGQMHREILSPTC